MERILNFFDKNTNGKCYKSFKYSLDDVNVPTLKYDDKPQIVLEPKAETNRKRLKYISVEDEAKKYIGNSTFKYFLDGSRKTYKVDDIAIGKRIYPIIAGQIAVGCCHRPGISTFKRKKLEQHFVLSLPIMLNTDGVPDAPFFSSLIDELNKNPILEKMNVRFSKILPYETELLKKNNSGEKEKYEDRGVTLIQNEMMDLEQEIVHELWKENLLNDSSYLLKDGSLEYSKRYSIKGHDLSKLKRHYKYVVGVSKSFNPELFKSDNESIARTIAELPAFHRTEAFKYVFEGTTFCVWYLRIRKNIFNDHQFAGVVKVEMILTTEEEIEEGMNTDVINQISAHLINERNPVCYGTDKRWANHIYPVYLTESFIKSQYIGDSFFLNLF
ncbi:MAG: hypothetical protein LBD80_05050 [Tannerella sp.]|jgi:hypothetical protein|nr:hypothetical protein [Tannerella sp.]